MQRQLKIIMVCSLSNNRTTLTIQQNNSSCNTNIKCYTDTVTEKWPNGEDTLSCLSRIRFQHERYPANAFPSL